MTLYTTATEKAGGGCIQSSRPSRPTGWAWKTKHNHTELALQLERVNCSLRAALRPGYGEAAVRPWLDRAKASLTNTNDHNQTFLLPLDLLPWVLLQPFALLAFPTLHFLVPLQRGLSLHLDVLISLSTKPRSGSSVAPDRQPAIAWKQGEEPSIAEAPQRLEQAQRSHRPKPALHPFLPSSQPTYLQPQGASGAWRETSAASS